MMFGIKNLFNKSEGTERRSRKRARIPAQASILIVDDSRTAVVMLQKMLAHTGYKLLTASNGVEGVEMTITHQPDLVLMDIIMPGLNGFQATRKIAKHPLTKHIPVILVSGNEQATEQFWGIKVGARGFLSKPVERGDLFSLIDQQLYLDTAV